MTQSAAVSAIVLAAGAGRRFGATKLLAPLEARPLAGHVAAVIAVALQRGVLAGGVAVIPPQAATLRSLFTEHGLSPLENPEADTGLASSLRSGLAHLGQDPTLGAALIVLADQPRLRLEVIEAVVAAWRISGRSVRPRYRDAPAEPGHPVVLVRSLWRLTDRLSGDEGLREVLQGAQVQVIDVEGRNPDVDTPGDLASI